MTDILAAARERQSHLANEIAKINDFISMAEALKRTVSDSTVHPEGPDLGEIVFEKTVTHANGKGK